MGTPPVTFFTIPVPIPGVKTVQVMNQTTGPSHIGLGYIVDGQMSPAAIWENVQKNALLVSQTPEPILRAFVEVQGAEAPSPGDPHSAPIWQQDLLSLSTNTMVMISPDNHGWYDALTYSMDEGGKPVTPTADGVVAPAKPDKADESEEEVTSETETDDGARGAIPQSDDHWKVRIYRAEVAFEDAGVVPKAARVICGQLSRKGYVANVVQKDREVYATIAMTVLHGGSCAQAEKDLLSVLDSEDLRMEAPNVKAHDGLAMVSGGQGRDAIFSHWRPITPCDSEWW
ncbi:hypothetical protein BV20DRAFT_965376 [Pilatotrama ljubarskyi]|nr:hypothetical protein BV20DRAFT_965376 [Pilatotrama ljubarskyi]